MLFLHCSHSGLRGQRERENSQYTKECIGPMQHNAEKHGMSLKKSILLDEHLHFLTIVAAQVDDCSGKTPLD